MVKSGGRKYEYIENMKWREVGLKVGVVRDDGGLKLMKNTGVNFFKLRTFRGTKYVNYQDEENEGKEYGYLVGIH